MRVCLSLLQSVIKPGASLGIEVSIGAHYPASHPNNVLQLFTAQPRSADHPAVRQLSDWSRGGRLEAVQLELGIPLRWPGKWRDRFITVVRRSDLEIVNEFGGPGVGPGQLGRPHNLTVDPSGNIFVAEAAGPKVKHPVTGAEVDAGFRAQKFRFTGTRPAK